MVDKELRKALHTYGEENEQELKIFDEPAYDKSIIGFSSTGVIVYDYEKMIEEFMEDNNCTYEEAMDFVNYNTMRALPYFGEGKPIVIVETPDSIKEKY